MEFRAPLTLPGRCVRLVPLALEHGGRLTDAGRDPTTWRYLRVGPATALPAMRELIVRLLERRDQGVDLPFSVEERPSGRLVGMTRFLDIDRTNATVEIGGTWLATEAQRTPVNTEAKRLLLAHAFEVEGAHRVQLKTDLRNERSQSAIRRLGATREGILREHLVLPDGYRRSSVVFSILADEWPAVRDRLDRFLARPWPPAGRGAAPTEEGTRAAASR
jgi:N-acetyltransferase